MTDIVPAELFGCFDAPEELTRLDVARRHIVDTCPRVDETEDLALDETLDRVLAAPAVSTVAIPAADNSAMDGFAIAGAALPDSGDADFSIVGAAFAGHPFQRDVMAGDAVRIMTGAYLPQGTDTVIAQEHAVAHADGDRVRIGPGHRPGTNVRAAGEDIRIGDTVLAPGKRIGNAEIGVLASIGKDRATVFAKPRVGVFSTGDEVVEPGATPAHGQLFDCNRALLKSMLRSTGCEVLDLGIVDDNETSVTETLTRASPDVDAIISSGGISTGAADHVADSVRALGELGVWRIALRPGRPFAYGRIGRSRFFGLPGNPVAVMVTFYMLVVPALRRIAGDSQVWQPHEFLVPCLEPIRKKPNRTELYRAVLSVDEHGQLSVTSTGNQGSGLLTSMSRANCFIVLDHERAGTEANELVPVLPFPGLFGS